MSGVLIVILLINRYTATNWNILNLVYNKIGTCRNWEQQMAVVIRFFPPLPSSWVMSGEVATCAVMHTYTSKISWVVRIHHLPIIWHAAAAAAATSSHMDSNSSIRCLVLPWRIWRRVLYLSRPAFTFSAWIRSLGVLLLSSTASASSLLRNWKRTEVANEQQKKKKPSSMRLFRSLTPSAPCNPPPADTPLSAVIKSIFVRSCMQYHGLFRWWDREQFCLSRTMVGWAASDFCALIKTNKMMIMRPQQY